MTGVGTWSKKSKIKKLSNLLFYAIREITILFILKSTSLSVYILLSYLLSVFNLSTVLIIVRVLVKRLRQITHERYVLGSNPVKHPMTNSLTLTRLQKFVDLTQKQKKIKQTISVLIILIKLSNTAPIVFYYQVLT